MCLAFSVNPVFRIHHSLNEMRTRDRLHPVLRLWVRRDAVGLLPFPVQVEKEFAVKAEEPPESGSHWSWSRLLQVLVVAGSPSFPLHLLSVCL